MTVPSSHYDALIIGGGFYGCSVAAFLGAKSYRVLLVEKEEGLLKRASYVNQARVHNGYHYPRSLITAMRAAVNFPRFVLDFKECVDDSFQMIYPIARQDSKVTAHQFAMFCKRIGAPAKQAEPKISALFSSKLIEDVFCVQEYAFDAARLAVVMERRLEKSSVEVRQNLEVLRIEPAAGNTATVFLADGDVVTANHVFNCTYSQINNVLCASHLAPLQMKHEITELTLVEPPPTLKGYGVTVMDGPFFSMGLRKKRPSQRALRCCNGWSKPVFSFFEDF